MEAQTVTFSIDAATIIGITSIITSIVTGVISIIVAVRQTTTNRVIRRVEIQSNSMSERLQNVSYEKGKAEEQVKNAAQVISQVAAEVPKAAAVAAGDAAAKAATAAAVAATATAAKAVVDHLESKNGNQEPKV